MAYLKDQNMRERSLRDHFSNTQLIGLFENSYRLDNKFSPTSLVSESMYP